MPATPVASPAIGYLTELRSHHRRQIGDYRTGYRIVCSVCSVLRSEPGYNERVSWREAEAWPCRQVELIDSWLHDEFGIELPDDRTDHIARNIERLGKSR